MLKELNEYFDSIKKTQAEMKVTLNEIKKNPQGTNSGGDEAETQINDLEHKEEKNIQSEQQEKRIFFKKPWMVWLTRLTTNLQTERSPVQFPVRAHAWIVGQVPSWGHVGGS